jgi:hypothetical protein
MGTNLETAEFTEDSLSQRLLPLLSGQPVVMSVVGGRLPKKRRVGDCPLLMITPVSVYGDSSGKLVVALQGFGCEVVCPGTVSATHLHYTGLPWKLSKALSECLNNLFTYIEVNYAKCQ